MKKIILVVVRDNVCYVNKFDSVTDAYYFYLDEFSTFGDWWYYLRVAHKLLNRVTDEEIMECVFKHCFTDAVITKERI